MDSDIFLNRSGKISLDSSCKCNTCAVG